MLGGVTVDECKFRKGDRVQLVDREPVYEMYRGAVGTVIDVSSLDALGYIRVLYDHFGEFKSTPATLVLIDDNVDTTELNSFLENQ